MRNISLHDGGQVRCGVTMGNSLYHKAGAFNCEKKSIVRC